MGPLWDHFGMAFAYEGDFEASLGPLWAYFLHLRVTLEALWRHRGVTLKNFGIILGHFGVTWEPLWDTWAQLWDHLGVTLGHIGVTLGTL